MTRKELIKSNNSDLITLVFYSFLLLVFALILYKYPVVSFPAILLLTIGSTLIYKREVLIPEKETQKAWIAAFFFVVIAVFFIMVFRRQEIINAFGSFFIDGQLKNIEKMNEGPEGGEFLEEVTAFIPDSKKGVRLLKYFEYSLWIIGAVCIFINYKLLDYESEKTKTDFWFISVLISHFDDKFGWTKQAVPTKDFEYLLKYQSLINEEKNWALKQKINFQLTVFRTDHYKGAGGLPDSWEISNKACLTLAEAIVSDTVYHFRNNTRKIIQNNKHLPYEKELIVKSIAYYINAIRRNEKVIENKVQKNYLLSGLFNLFYFVQDYIKFPMGKETRKLNTILREDLLYKESKIIIAEDMKLFRNGIKTYLEKFDSIKIVSEAENGQELLELLKNKSADVISLNIQMPVMDGFTFMESYPLHEDPKIAILSFLDAPKIVLKALSLGASSYLCKSQGGDTIAKMYKQVHAYGFYYSADMHEAIKMFNEDTAKSHN